MRELPPLDWHAARAEQLQPLLQQLVQTMLDWTPE
jgi:N-formylglutamate amidohydrolase